MGSETSRARELGAVFVYAVVIAVTTPIVAEMLATAWDDRGIPFELVLTATKTLGVNFDLGIIVPIGFVLALVVLFCLDEYKRVQAPLVVLGCVVLVVALVRMGRWTELIDWERYWWGLIPGATVGLVGIHGAKLPSRGRREFPGAARWLYRVTALVIVVGLFEYHLSYTNGLGFQVRDMYMTLPASLLLVLAVAEFVKYSNRKDIVIIGGNDTAESDLLGGLFSEARGRFDGVPLDPDGSGQGAVFLNKAAAAPDSETLPERNDISTVSFKFSPGGFFSRQIVVTANRFDPPSRRDLELFRSQVTSEEGVGSSVGRFVTRRLSVLVPRIIRRALNDDSRRMSDRLRSADSVLLIAPISDFVREDRLDSGEFDDWRELVSRTPPEYAAVYAGLCDVFTQTSRRGIVVTPEASLAMRAYEERENRYPSYRDPAFTSFVKNTILTGNDPETAGPACDIITVDRNQHSEDEPPVGFDTLLITISK